MKLSKTITNSQYKTVPLERFYPNAASVRPRVSSGVIPTGLNYAESSAEFKVGGFPPQHLMKTIEQLVALIFALIKKALTGNKGAPLSASSLEPNMKLPKLSRELLPATPFQAVTQTGDPVSNHAENLQGTFLWKPESDSDGKLVILLPHSLTGQVQRVFLQKSGTSLAEGRYTSLANGNREHYRFNTPGNQLPTGTTAVAILKNGEQVRFTVDDVSKRTEKRY